jgi:pimeloyl-ACP methyl ester carboxylesterase
MRPVFIITISLFFLTFPVFGQSVTETLPEKIDPAEKYLFYLHGGVVQQQGVNAVSQHYGEYKFLDILDSLSHRGFNVISEVRPKEMDEVTYARKLESQIDTLFTAGVSPQNISIVGASLGAYIALETALILKKPQINYALLGLCSEYDLEYFSKYKHELHGKFLSIYESTDEKGPCQKLFTDLPPNSSFKEIWLDMGNSHAFLFKPYPEWINPLVHWIREIDK